MPAPKLLFPIQPADPLRALLRRIGVALGILGLVAVVTWIGRGGYRDVDGSSVTFLDAVYYASVTVTTTGYGDVTPVSNAARAVTTFVVTPARVLFLIVLVGTTIELLTERFREALAESRWRKRVSKHVIIAGYGTKGRGAVDALLASGAATPTEIVAIDLSHDAIAEARAQGITGIVGDATRTAVLQQARVSAARAVIVTCQRDDTATLIALTARELNADCSISAAVREVENAHLLDQSGATTVIISSEASGRMLGMAASAPRAVGVLEDLLLSGHGLDIEERTVRDAELGGPPQPLGNELPVAVVRAGIRIPFHAAEFGNLQANDVVVSVTGR